METKDLSGNIAALSADGGSQLLDLVNSGRESALLALAVEIQRQFHDPTVEFCAIVNAKSGNCSHNCSFCAQSGISKSLVAVYPFGQPDALLEAARAAEAGGAHRFSIVTSGARLSKKDMLMACEAIRLIKEETNLLPCASVGKITVDDAQMLKEAGLVRYHHNLESNRDFYPRICTTQTYQERLATIMVAKEAGLEICVGGIFGMGESIHDRIKFALEIKNLNPDSVPINLLDPRPGTPLEAQALLTTDEAVLAIALFRIIMPYTNLRLAGGRGRVLAERQAEAIKTGLNGLMIGDYLVTKGAEVDADHALIASLGLTPSVAKKNAGVYN
ncbi:MAG: biotin synthase BioB [Syntrophales bacterium]|nr:biotin synthase BioB [Syntrophales bacterium]